ncbi:hypothetical protein OG339_48315 (plasmid) [Streptosporangium sp. NBC_01495]|uniref:hypothetical protein n=1 Tax=Streptosporangium sp. NBC_01495 TaxID=2903899 RepID=UPI002E37966B|nr:hypothetical protein [Streptosporangium sp. NBC_01495]
MTRRFPYCPATRRTFPSPSAADPKHPLLSWANYCADPGPEPLPEAAVIAASATTSCGAAWKGQALLAGTLPYARFTLTGHTALRWCHKAGRRGRLLYTFKRDSYVRGHEVHHDRLLITAARTDTYATLFDLGAIISAYRRALPAELAEREIDSLLAHRHRCPADHLGLPEALSDLKRSVRGITLGHPIALTTALIMDAAQQMPPEMWQALRS